MCGDLLAFGMVMVLSMWLHRNEWIPLVWCLNFGLCANVVMLVLLYRQGRS